MAKSRIEVVNSFTNRKAVMCFDCTTITYVEFPTGLIRVTWADDPLPKGWQWVLSDFPSTMGICLRPKCDVCLAETDPEKLAFRIANSRNLNFRDAN